MKNRQLSNHFPFSDNILFPILKRLQLGAIFFFFVILKKQTHKHVCAKARWERSGTLNAFEFMKHVFRTAYLVVSRRK